MAKDYYNILGVSRGAGDEEIKSAYKRLAKQHHPDVNKDHGSEAKFKEVQEAYSVLSDANKKAQYDRFGSDFEKYGSQGGGFSGFGQGGFSGGALSATSIADSGTLGVTGQTTLTSASTTQLSVFQRIYLGGTATSTFDSDGNFTLAGLLTGTNTGTSTLSGGDVNEPGSTVKTWN